MNFLTEHREGDGIQWDKEVNSRNSPILGLFPHSIYSSFGVAPLCDSREEDLVLMPYVSFSFFNLSITPNLITLYQIDLNNSLLLK